MIDNYFAKFKQASFIFGNSLNKMHRYVRCINGITFLVAMGRIGFSSLDYS